MRSPASTAPHILLAEDDDILREVMTAILTAAGYKVTSCPDAETAEAVVVSCVRPDVLLTDIEMPGESGIWLAEQLTMLMPNLPVIIVSAAILQEQQLSYIDGRG